MNRNYILLLTFLFAIVSTSAQRPINTIFSVNSTDAPITYNNVKGAGLRQASGAMRSSWDSAGTDFTVNYNVGRNNVTSITQLTVNGLPSSFISWPLNAFIRIRRNANAYVDDTRAYYNFWAKYSSTPTGGYGSGTFNFNAPEVVAPENALLSNNVNSGYDNIFQNTINNLHAGNIERVDFILPVGLKPVLYDIENAGTVVFDRGVGDPFKVAAILSLDNNKDPLVFGPLVSVTAAQFGPNLDPNSISYCIITHDPKFGNQSRPSAPDVQNLRGVFITLGDLGIAANQRFYGFALFGPDVATADPDWTTYPTNTDGGSMLDPVNVMTLFKETNSLLPIGLSFTLTKQNNKAFIKFPVYDIVNNQNVAIERSANGRDYEEIGREPISHMGDYYYTDEQPLPGTSFYRLKLVEKAGGSGYSEIKTIRMDSENSLQVSPNPAKDLITIGLPLTWQSKQITASLFDATGALVQQKNFTASKTEIIFPLTKVNTGTYFLRVTNIFNQESVVKQVVVSK